MKRAEGPIKNCCPICGGRQSILILLPLLLFLLCLSGQAYPQTFKVVEKEFLWLSSNFTKTDSKQASKGEKGLLPLSSFSFRNHFDSHGTPPPFHFLLPLTAGPSPLAEIKDGYLLFRKTGKKISLSRSVVPSYATRVPPYLLPIPRRDRVLVVYPYYVYQDRENRYVTEIYSDQGALLSTFDNLPTHASLHHPDLLISPEKSGCCDSLKWSIRFYNLEKGSVAEYSCPEGFCGDLLFTKLGDRGPFFIALEIVGKAGEIGASMQTNFYIVEEDGTLSATGKTIYLVREPNVNRRRLDSLSPYAISNLISMDLLPGKDSWIIHFDVRGQRTALKLVSASSDIAPAVVYLLSKYGTESRGKASLKIGDHFLGVPPLFGMARPGPLTFVISFEDGHEENIRIDAKSDLVHVIMF